MRPRGRSRRSAPIRRWSARTSTPPGPGTRCPRSWPQGAPPNDKNPAARPGREALGRSRGGLSTKIHLAADRFGKLKQFRAVATRYDKRDFMYQATVDVASIRIWLRDP
jgi:transposase